MSERATRSETDLENLSALIDAEMTPEASRFLLRRVAEDEYLLAAWERYRIAGDCLRGRRLGMAAPDFADRVRAALADVPEERVRTSARGTRRWAGALTLAASVSLAVMLTLSLPERPPSFGGDAGPPADAVTPSATLQTPPPTDAPTLADAEFEAYLVRHNAALRQNGLEGFVPFVDLVTSAGAQSVAYRSHNLATELR